MIPWNVEAYLLNIVNLNYIMPAMEIVHLLQQHQQQQGKEVEKLRVTCEDPEYWMLECPLSSSLIYGILLFCKSNKIHCNISKT